MKRWVAWGVVGVCVAAVVLGVAGVGCDSVTQSGDVVITTDVPALMATGRVAVVITANDTNGTLYLPLEWSVSDATLGTVTKQGALTALYQGNAQVGINTVTVKDQGNAEGLSVINHVPANGMELQPMTNELNGAGAQMQFAVTPGSGVALPLVWTSGNEGYGVIISSSGLQAVYQATGAIGDNFVTVRDQMGAAASAIVFHR